MISTSRTLRIWLLLSLALPKTDPDRDFIIELAADAFLEAWRSERTRRSHTTALGVTADA